MTITSRPAPTALDLIQNVSLETAMTIAKDMIDAIDYDETSKAVCNIVAEDLMFRFNDRLADAKEFAAKYGICLTVALA